MRNWCTVPVTRVNLPKGESLTMSKKVKTIGLRCECGHWVKVEIPMKPFRSFTVPCSCGKRILVVSEEGR
jgi:hypothetical protein